jgi:hypothetical protein
MPRFRQDHCIGHALGLFVIDDRMLLSHFSLAPEEFE